MERAFDVTVIGGGLVGLASAYALSGRGQRILLLEQAPTLAAHQSGRNSGVIHSGLYYAPGSSRAELCVRGREQMYSFCAAEGIPHRRSGKVVIADGDEERERLGALESRGRANGLKGLQRLDQNSLREIEPAAVGAEALWVPDTGVVDFRNVAAALASHLRFAGVDVRTEVRVIGVRRRTNSLLLLTTKGTISTRLAVGCAGLHAERLAQAFGFDPSVTIVPVRGEYHELIPPRRSLVRSLIYPVPDPSLPFLGVHLTRTIDGRVEVGPNAVLALAREGYDRGSFVLQDVWALVSRLAFWRMARRHWKVGLREAVRARSRDKIAEALAALVPGLSGEDLLFTRSGIRAQAVDRQGRLVDDFVIVQDESSVHVLNAPSPAATACLAIGEHIAARLSALR